MKNKTYWLMDKNFKKHQAKAANYIAAAKKMGVTPHELRTYGHIVDPKNSLTLHKIGGKRK